MSQQLFQTTAGGTQVSSNDRALTCYIRKLNIGKQCFMFNWVILISVLFEHTRDKYQKQAFHFLPHTFNISSVSHIAIFFFKLNSRKYFTTE